MNLLKSLIKRKATTLFFIIAFTIGILVFSIGSSALVSQSNKSNEYNSTNSKLLSLRNYQNLSFKDIKDILQESNLNFILRKPYYSDNYGIETRILNDQTKLNLDMKDGKPFTNEELKDNGLNGIYSSRMNEEIEEYLPFEGKKIKINKVASYYEIDRIIIISNELFYKFYESEDLNALSIVAQGKQSDIENLANKFETMFKDKENKSSQEEGLIITNISDIGSPSEGKALYQISIMIFVITIINSIAISSLWVKNRKKEIVLRKVMGAKDRDIAKIFFGELTIISISSLVLALIIQNLLVLFTSGFISDIDLRPTFISFIYSFFISIIAAFAVSIPSLKHISKIQPAEMLKEE